MLGILAATLMALSPINEPGYYAIKDNIEGQHGKVTYVCDQMEEGKYLSGSTVTLTVNPSIFYEMSEKPTANVELTQDAENDKVFTFVMPEYEVSINYTITLNHYIEELKSNEMIGFIVTWVIDSGFLTALIIIFAKYRKYKSMTTEELNKVIQEKAIANITKAVQALDQEQLGKIYDTINSINVELDVLQKCFVLAQDKSPEGRAALMAYLDANVKAKSKSEEDNKEVKETIDEQKDKAVEDIKKQEEVINKIDEEYQPVE